MINLTAKQTAKSATRIHPGYYLYRGYSIERIDCQNCWLVFASYTVKGRPQRQSCGRFSTLKNAKRYVDWKRDCIN